jgi:hypothetical protein
MATFVVDWRRFDNSGTTETWKNHFNFDPLNISSKDGLNCEMDARIIMEIDDDSVIIKNFGSFPVFVENMLSILVRNFFTYKEMVEMTLNRLKVQEEFSKLAEEKLTKYGVKVTVFMIANMSMLSPIIVKNEERKDEIKQTGNFKDKDSRDNILLIFFGGLLLLSVWLGITLADKQSVNIDYRFSVVYVIIVPILAIILIYQYFEIKKLRTMLAK